MLIVADENIPYVGEAFAALGEVRLMPGREMNPEAVREAEILLVRSVTRVDDALLGESRMRFVGTATIGTDHVDQPALARRGIRFQAAPGSNANSVAEYIVAALLTLAGRTGATLAARSLGIVGVGNVGSRVEAKARALGMAVVLNDPPLLRTTGDAKYRPLDELFECDFITLHVPLEKDGVDPTWHLADESFLRRIGPGTVVLNSSRGAVVDNRALLAALDAGEVAAPVLDVWEGEPQIDTDLLERTALGTPHIAGYSFDGKVNGTAMLYEAACDFMGAAPVWDAAAQMPPPEHERLLLETSAESVESVLRQAVLTVYPIERDDAALRRIVRETPDARSAFFDRLRREYPVRREFHNTGACIAGAVRAHSGQLREMLHGVGFKWLQRRDGDYNP